MLRGVLLHVVNAARPIHMAMNGAERDLGGGVVDDVVVRARGTRRALVGIQNFHYGGAAELAKVVGLTTGGGIERSLVQYHAKTVPLTVAGDHLRVEFAQK
jgi:hypothetical protein